MTDRPVKTNTWGNSPNRKAPVTISTWDENASSVRRLRRPYVIEGDRPARPMSLETASVKDNGRAAEPSLERRVQGKRSARPISLDDADGMRSSAIEQSRRGFRVTTEPPVEPQEIAHNLLPPTRELRRMSVKDAVSTLSVPSDQRRDSGGLFYFASSYCFYVNEDMHIRGM